MVIPPIVNEQKLSVHECILDRFINVIVKSPGESSYVKKVNKPPRHVPPPLFEHPSSNFRRLKYLIVSWPELSHPGAFLPLIQKQQSVGPIPVNTVGLLLMP